MNGYMDDYAYQRAVSRLRNLAFRLISQEIGQPGFYDKTPLILTSPAPVEFNTNLKNKQTDNNNSDGQ